MGPIPNPNPNDNFEAKTKLVFKDTSEFKRSVEIVVWNIHYEKEEQRKIVVAYKLAKNQEINVIDKENDDNNSSSDSSIKDEGLAELKNIMNHNKKVIQK